MERGGDPPLHRMRIALFGGSFDPPHIGHQLACQYVLLTHAVDEVWMVPVFRHAFDKRSSPFAHRVAMCRIAASSLDSGRVRVDTIEEDLAAAGGGPSYTLLTVRALKRRHPEHHFSLIIGTDLLKERERWYHFPELAAELQFLVIGRDGVSGIDEGTSLARDVRHAEPLLMPAVSSTEVRERLARGERPAGWVAREILDYIERHGLYRAVAPVPSE